MSGPVRGRTAPAIRLVWHVIPEDEHGPAQLSISSTDHGTMVQGIIAAPEEWETDGKWSVDLNGTRLDGYPLDVAYVGRLDSLALACWAVQALVAPLWAADRFAS